MDLFPWTVTPDAWAGKIAHWAVRLVAWAVRLVAWNNNKTLESPTKLAIMPQVEGWGLQIPPNGCPYFHFSLIPLCSHSMANDMLSENE